jgi:aspartate/methionine/tyrosine aminotransferase
MNKLAENLNKTLEGTVAGYFLSPLGKELFFPRGIAMQAAEAKKHATNFNATVGMAFNEGEPLILPTIQDNLPRLTPSEAVAYAPTPGDPRLRDVWKEGIIRKNPSIDPDHISRPIVVPGLTAGIAQVADLFISPGDKVFIPDMYWGNYNLIFETRKNAQILPFEFFTSEGTLNIQGLLEEIRSKATEKKAALILNFPNNPTGYSPSIEEARALEEGLVTLAKDDYKLLVIFDDAYFGLFYEEETFQHSLFGPLYNAHENILAVKVDGATKEDYVWGFRVGFVTFGGHGLKAEQLAALEEKLTGNIRATFSNSSRVAQTLLFKELSSMVYHGIKEQYAELMKRRYLKVKSILEKRTTGHNLQPLPFNSGYFMTFELITGSAEELRTTLLKQEGIGTISIKDRYLRIAYSSIDLRDLEELYSIVFSVSDALFS